MTVYGYARVSTLEQNTAVQIAALKRAGVDCILQEKKSAVLAERPVLEALLKKLEKGDVLVFYKLDRLARSVSHFVRIFEDLQQRGVAIRSLTEALDTTTPYGRMMLHMLSAFAELEWSVIRERCVAGQRAARAAGKTWGKKRALNDEEVELAVNAWRSGWYQQRVLADMLGVSVSCLRDHIHRYERRGRWATTNRLHK